MQHSQPRTVAPAKLPLLVNMKQFWVLPTPYQRRALAPAVEPEELRMLFKYLLPMSSHFRVTANAISPTFECQPVAAYSLNCGKHVGEAIRPPERMANPQIASSQHPTPQEAPTCHPADMRMPPPTANRIEHMTTSHQVSARRRSTVRYLLTNESTIAASS